jgi:uncharacterized protein (DUF111 family)
MKKNRPGTLLTVVARPDERSRMTDIVFSETTTIGLDNETRTYDDKDRIAEMSSISGEVRFKVARRDGRVMNAVPEFDDCARLAAANNLPVKEVQAIAARAYRSQS